jgi:sulfate/thiosulfate transport system permease protein
MSVVARSVATGRRTRLFDTVRRRLLIVFVVAYAAILVLAPVAALIGGALSQGLGAVAAALAQPDVLHAFELTLEIAAIVVAVHAVFGTVVAWVLARHHFWGRSLVNGLIDLPFAVSAVVVGYMLLLIFGRNGLLAPLLEGLGLKIAFAVPGMVLATLFVSLPFMVRELLPVLQAFEVEQEQAAATLGASGWQTFWWVTFPALRWGFLYGVVLTFARALGEFGAVLVIGGAIQGLTETATLYVFRALDQREYVGAYSAALVLGLFSLALVTGIDFVRRRER